MLIIYNDVPLAFDASNEAATRLQDPFPLFFFFFLLFWKDFFPLLCWGWVGVTISSAPQPRFRSASWIYIYSLMHSCAWRQWGDCLPCCSSDTDRAGQELQWRWRWRFLQSPDRDSRAGDTLGCTWYKTRVGNARNVSGPEAEQGTSLSRQRWQPTEGASVLSHL